MSVDRLFNPKTIAVIGGGAWCEGIIGAAKQLGFDGEIIPVHPTGKSIAGLPSLTDLANIQQPIDAAFVGVNRHAKIDTISALRALNAGGAVCFASGFSEATAELAEANQLQTSLVAAAGDMPILGPNCYGFLNALDGVGIWPDQHGLLPVEKGVAILTQSSNIAINLTMQKRGLPIGMVITCGNQAQQDQATLAMALLDDPRITAIGLHIEGFGDLSNWEALAAKAFDKGIPLVALKVGQSSQARAGTISHTASLSGSHDGAQAFLRRLGIASVDTLTVFIETLNILHTIGPLKSRNIASVSCSGGEASLIADSAHRIGLTFPPLLTSQRDALLRTLGPKVALANPLDYHTYIWRDLDAMTTAWSAMVSEEIALTLIILDFPRNDRCVTFDWDIATRAAIAVRNITGRPIAVVSSLPETLPEQIADQLQQADVAALHGLDDALCAVLAASQIAAPCDVPCQKPTPRIATVTWSEAQAKEKLTAFGLPIPNGNIVTNPPQNGDLIYPCVLKGLGHAHKSDRGLVAIDLRSPEDVETAMSKMTSTTFLIEEMVTDGIAELLVGIQHDPAMGLVLTVAAGGIYTELLQDTATCLLPASDQMIGECLAKLKIYKILMGYRGKPAADIPCVIASIQAICSYALANASRVTEIEINPLICTPTRAVAVDALIREAE